MLDALDAADEEGQRSVGGLPPAAVARKRRFSALGREILVLQRTPGKGPAGAMLGLGLAASAQATSADEGATTPRPAQDGDVARGHAGGARRGSLVGAGAAAVRLLGALLAPGPPSTRMSAGGAAGADGAGERGEGIGDGDGVVVRDGLSV